MSIYKYNHTKYINFRRIEKPHACDFTLSRYEALCKALISSGFQLDHRAGVTPGGGGGAIRYPVA